MNAADKRDRSPRLWFSTRDGEQFLKDTDSLIRDFTLPGPEGDGIRRLLRETMFSVSQLGNFSTYISNKILRTEYLADINPELGLVYLHHLFGRLSNWMLGVNGSKPLDMLTFIDVFREHISPTLIPDLMKERFFIDEPLDIYFEDIAKEGKAIETFLALKNIALPIDPIKLPSGSKEDRILSGIGKYYRDGRIYHPTINGEPMSWQNQFEEEYIEFPKSKHDDILDCEDVTIRGILKSGMYQLKFMEHTSKYINDLIGVNTFA